MKIYNPYLSESMFFKPEQMYGENRKVFEDIPYIDKGKIYFLAVRNRVRIIPESVELLDTAKIKFEILIDGANNKVIEVDAAPLFIDFGSKIREVFKNSKSLQEHMVAVKDTADYMEKLRNSTKSSPLIGVSYIKDKQNKKSIPLKIHTPDGREGELPFTVHSILSEFEIDIADFPKILYIGKSEKLNNRIYRHEKIQEALAVVDDEDDIYLYSFQFKDKRINLSMDDSNFAIHKEEKVNDINAEDRISLVEMALINYFKPKMNSDYVNSDLNQSEIFKRALSKKYTHLVQEVDHDGEFWNFGSDVVPPALRHEISYDVTC
jgi:hypothetical protein